MTSSTSTSGLLPIPPATLRAWGWLPALTRPGRIYVGPCGELLRADDDGHLEPVHQGGTPWHKSIASDPAARRAA